MFIKHARARTHTHTRTHARTHAHTHTHRGTPSVTEIEKKTGEKRNGYRTDYSVKIEKKKRF